MSSWGHRLKNSILVEEYISGKEYSVEGIVQNNRVYFYSITEKIVYDQAQFLEIGHVVPAAISEELKENIHDYVKNVLHVLEFNHTPFHAELRLNANYQPVLMEVAARLAGDKIGDIVSLSSSVNFLEQILSVYLNQDLIAQTDQTECVGIRFFYRENVDSYSEIKCDSEINDQHVLEIKYYYSAFSQIPAFPKPLRRLGHVIVKGKHSADVLAKLNEIDEKTEFVGVICNHDEKLLAS